MALGARQSDVRSLVIGRAMILTACGLGIGLASAWATTRFLESLLFGITAHDPAVFVVVPAVLACVALAASYLPAWRATRIDPIVALRAE
jgi:putative ABC transport system permease protein